MDYEVNSLQATEDRRRDLRLPIRYVGIGNNANSQRVRPPEQLELVTELVMELAHLRFGSSVHQPV